MKVFVYFNLHNKMWSLKALDGEFKGLVIGHATDVFLKNVKGKVSESGRQRVLQERRKNVHAGIEGELIRADLSFKRPLVLDEVPVDEDISKMLSREVTYNPYKNETFVYRYGGEEFNGSTYCYMEAQTRKVTSYEDHRNA